VLDSLLSGVVTGLALIVAIGAQNAFVLRQGLARNHVGLVVVLCAASDLVLIVAGVAGIGTVVEQAPWALAVVRWLGVAFLTWYGLASLLRAREHDALAASGRGGLTSRSAALGALALTWLNPHVYLDTVLLLGSVASSHGSPGRWWFAAGACAASIVWFTGLGSGARLLAGLLAKPRAWQVLEVLIGTTMLAIATGLAVGGNWAGLMLGEHIGWLTFAGGLVVIASAGGAVRSRLATAKTVQED
jgi:L-lysine exporter family protein LysE/ArgO